MLDVPFHTVTVTHKITYEYAWQVLCKMVNFSCLNSAIPICKLQVLDSYIRTKEIDFFFKPLKHVNKTLQFACNGHKFK